MHPTTSFQTLKRSTIRITDMNTDRVWEIRDDTPMAIIVQYIDIMMTLRKYENLREVITADPTEAVQAKEAILETDRLHAEYLLAIFQHTYPETTLDEIERHFATEDRQELAALFFILRTRRSSQQQESVVQMAQRQAAALASTPSPTSKRPSRRR